MSLATTTERTHEVADVFLPASVKRSSRPLPESRGIHRRPGWIRRNRLLLSVLTVALLARLWDLASTLPVLHHPDEPANLRRIELIVASGDLNPHFFNYPSLFLYLQGAVSLDGPIFGWLIPGDRAVPPVTNVMGSTFAPSVYTVLIHRALSVACGVALVAVVWAIARRTIGGKLGPAVAAGLIALSPNLIEHSQYVTPDMLATLMVACAVLAALRVMESGSTGSYVLAGAVVGLAMSAKYNAALVAVAVVAAFVVRFVQDRDRSSLGNLVLSGNAALAAFLLTTPYALLDHAMFLKGVQFERAHYASGHVGMQGDTPSFYAGVLLREEAAITLPALIGIGLLLTAVRAHWRWLAVLMAFPVVYGLFVFSMPVRNDRTIMVILPMLAVLAGYAVSAVARAATERTAPLHRAVAVAGAALLAVAALGGLWAGLTVNSMHDARVASAEWVSANLPEGSSIVVESYGPWIDPETYDVTGAATLLKGDPRLGTDYVVASEAMFGRFTHHADQFPRQAAAYERLFASLRLVQEFPQGENSIRIYEVPASGS